jgi:glycosyltransferase involved in cell wall biosynthesis
MRLDKMVEAPIRVDILLATFNGAPYLESQIDSIRQQTFRDWRLLISDDGSTDETVEILAAYERRDSRISISSVERKGGSAANFLRLVRCSDGDVFFLADQDDRWERHKIERMLKSVSSRELDEPHFVASDAFVVDDQLVVTADSYLRHAGISPMSTTFSKTLVQNPALGCASMGTRGLRSLINSANADPNRMIMHDWWFAIVASAFGSLRMVPDNLISYRQHSSNELGARKYSFRNLIRSSGAGMKKTHAILRQARHFEQLYGDRLPAERQSELTGFLEIFEAPAAQRAARLIQGGYTKDGLARRLGQTAFAIGYRDHRRK